MFVVRWQDHLSQQTIVGCRIIAFSNNTIIAHRKRLADDYSLAQLLRNFAVNHTSESLSHDALEHYVVQLKLKRENTVEQLLDWFGYVDADGNINATAEQLDAVAQYQQKTVNERNRLVDRFATKLAAIASPSVDIRLASRELAETVQTETTRRSRTLSRSVDEANEIFAGLLLLSSCVTAYTPLQMDKLGGLAKSVRRDLRAARRAVVVNALKTTNTDRRVMNDFEKKTSCRFHTKVFFMCLVLFLKGNNV